MGNTSLSVQSFNIHLYARFQSPQPVLNSTVSRDFASLLTILYNPTHRDHRFCPPPPLFKPVESYFLFYHAELEPYLSLYYTACNGNIQEEQLLEQCAHYFWLAVDILAGYWTTLRERFEARLLRASQCELVAIALDALTAQVRGIMAREKPGETGVVEIVGLLGTACKRTKFLLSHFLLSPKLRSERLEVLLLRYVMEKEVNMEVAEGIERAEDEKERRTREYEESVPFSLKDI